MKAFLILANGQVFEGESFGAAGTAVGEVVFNTAMAGYEEALTDPVYHGLLLAQSYPLIGNYGITGEDFESDHAQPAGYIVREVCDAPSNFRCRESLPGYLKAQGVVAICGIDTRRLVRVLRSQGSMNGAVTTAFESAEALAADAALLERVRAFSPANAVEEVTANSIKTHNENGAYHVALVDFGCRRSDVENLAAWNCKVSVVPAGTPAARLAQMGVQGVMLSGGPGDPARCAAQVETVRDICALGLPILAVGLGHQLLALSQGCAAERLPAGHYGANVPVREAATGRTYVTGQCHSYAIKAEGLPAGVTVSHANANDGSVEGLCYEGRPWQGVQFRPGRSLNACDTGHLFEAFVNRMKGGQ